MLLIVVATVIVTYLVTFVIPKFAVLYRDLGVERPASTKLLMALTVDYRFVVLGAVGVLAVLAFGVFLWSEPTKGAPLLTVSNSSCESLEILC